MQSDRDEDLLVVQTGGHADPEQRAPDVLAQVRRVRFGNPELQRKVLFKHLVTNVDDDRVHSCSQLMVEDKNTVEIIFILQSVQKIIRHENATTL